MENIPYIIKPPVALPYAQRSPCWSQFTCNKIRSSRVGVMLGVALEPPSSYFKQFIAQEIHFVDPHFKSYLITDKEDSDYKKMIMQHGIDNESNALQKLAVVLKRKISEASTYSRDVVGERDGKDITTIVATPDGSFKDDEGNLVVIEVKCPIPTKNDNHRVYYTQEKIKHEYFLQVQTQLLISGAAYCYFMVWTWKEYYIYKIRPSQEAFKWIVEEAINFQMRANNIMQYFVKFGKLPEGPSELGVRRKKGEKKVAIGRCAHLQTTCVHLVDHFIYPTETIPITLNKSTDV
jgi:hypothetical protein